MGLLDLRKGDRDNVVRHFGGFTGSIRSISAHSESPYFVSGGLDRHLYLHHLNQRKPLKKVGCLSFSTFIFLNAVHPGLSFCGFFQLYLKSRLNCVLMTDHFNKDFESVADEISEKVVWQNIDMESLDIPSAAATNSTSNQRLTPTPKKRKLHR